MKNNEEKYLAARLMLCKYLAQVAREKGITQEMISEKTGFTQPNVSRMLQGKYSPSLDNFMKIAESVGVYFFIIDKNADDDLVDMMKTRWSDMFEN